MRVGRALAVAVLVAAPVAASAQFGGMPGMPGTPGREAGPPPPACQELLTSRDETQKYGMAIQRANERKASAQEACELFKSYLSAELKFMKGIEEHARTCGVPPDVLKQVKDSHTRATQIGDQVCKVAAEGPPKRGPTGDFWWTVPPPGHR